LQYASATVLAKVLTLPCYYTGPNVLVTFIIDTMTASGSGRVMQLLPWSQRYRV
jgi:hypothetical protein